MGRMLRAQKRDIVFSLCQYGMDNVWEWGNEVDGNCWRTTGDITDSWGSMAGIGFAQAGTSVYAKPGRWNDPDMLVVGWVGWGPALHPTHLTPNEQYTHISLWSLLSSPLLIGCDLTKLDDFTLNLLTNDEVLEVNQDPLGHQARRFIKHDDVEVWAKALEDGSSAVGLFNLGEDEQPVSIPLARARAERTAARSRPLETEGSGCSVRWLHCQRAATWRGADQGRRDASTGQIKSPESAIVSAHGAIGRLSSRDGRLQDSSISSSDRPFVSGTKARTIRNASRLMPP